MSWQDLLFAACVVSAPVFGLRTYMLGYAIFDELRRLDPSWSSTSLTGFNARDVHGYMKRFPRDRLTIKMRGQLITGAVWFSAVVLAISLSRA